MNFLPFLKPLLSSLFTKWGPQIGGAGLLGLALYDFSQQDLAKCWHDLALGLGILGVHLNLPTMGQQKP